MKESKISVIIPVYKVEAYLRRCLDSVVGQTYRNLEIILVDDGSPDNSGAICDEYAARDARLIVLHTENQGVYAARNTGLDAVTGDYVGFVDADDWISEDMYESLLALLIQFNADIAQCGVLNAGKSAQFKSVKLGHEEVYDAETLTTAMFREEISHSLNDKLYRAEIWKTLRFPVGYYHADAATIAKIQTYCRTLVRTDRDFYFYNTDSESITRSQPGLKHIRSQEFLFEQYEEAAPYAAEAYGDYYICREIPCRGRTILPGGEIKLQDALSHIRYMHSIFIRHLPNAKKCGCYCGLPRIKKLAWRAYSSFPLLTSFLLFCAKAIPPGGGSI